MPIVDNNKSLLCVIAYGELKRKNENYRVSITDRTIAVFELMFLTFSLFTNPWKNCKNSRGAKDKCAYLLVYLANALERDGWSRNREELGETNKKLITRNCPMRMNVQPRFSVVPRESVERIQFLSGTDV